ncbi:hypothetical protein QFZ33_001561 [Arthrobacter globiformis]|nr:hypothetical protein [Arthrobacter globiformis]
MTRVAAIDCGTNSIRLLIADIDRSNGTTKLTDVVREMRVVRLGQGVDATGELAPEALERTFAATADYAALIREYQAQKVRFVATSASRDARNRQAFVDGIQNLIGVEPEVITGHEEAALSFAGASSVLPISAEDKVLVVDLGGGSTEFVLGDASGVIAARSVDIGCVRLTERHLTSDPAHDGADRRRGGRRRRRHRRSATGRSARTQHRRRRGCRLYHHHHCARPQAARIPAGGHPRRRTVHLRCPGRGHRSAADDAGAAGGTAVHAPRPGGRHRRRRAGLAAHPHPHGRAQRRPHNYGHRQ